MKLHHILALASALATATACVDSLDRFPLSSLSPETYFNSEEELQTYTNHFYSMLPGASDGYSESADVVSVFTLPSTTMGITRTIPTSGGGWDWGYLREINLYLQYSHRCTNATARTHYDGIARFFRAYFYFEKVKQFGDVPWYSKPLSSTDEDLCKPRDSRELVMDSIMADLDYAIANIPETSELYRVTGWTALALKSRVALFEGTFRKYHGLSGYEKFLNACVSASEELMNRSPYSIYSSGSKPYRDLFAAMDAKSQEVILARQYDYDKGIKHEANYNTMAVTYGRPGLNKKVVNSYLMTDGSRFTDCEGYATMSFYNEMQNRDPRLTQTVVGPGYTRINSETVESQNFSSTTTGYQIIKWVTDASGDGYMGSSNDYILFRMAEVYLNFAEAKAELGTLTQADLDRSIKYLRDRVGMPNMNLASANANPDPYLASAETGYRQVSGANKGILLELRRERTIELVLEGFRYADLLRWREGKMHEQAFTGIYFSKLNLGSGNNRYGIYDMNDGTLQDAAKVDIVIYTGTKPSVKNIRKFYKLGEEFTLTGGDEGNIIVHDITVEPRQWNEERDYFYPIPTTDRILTNGALTQNPGWDDGLSF